MKSLFLIRKLNLLLFLLFIAVGKITIANSANAEPNIPTPVDQNGRFVQQYSYTSPATGYSLGVQPIYEKIEKKQKADSGYVSELDKVNVSVGAYTATGPSYQGASRYGVAAMPSINMTYDDKVFASTRDGVGYHFIQNKDLTMTAALGYDAGRRQNQSAKLRGLGNIDSAYTANLIAEHRIRSFSNSLAVSSDPFSQGAGGYKVKLSSYYNVPVNEKLTVGVGPSTTFASDEYMDSYFGVNDSQAQSSGYKQYKASAGFENVAVNSRANYKLDKNTSLYGNASYIRLVGDAANSPISSSDNDYFVGIGVDYKLH